jgi:CHAT domain-containing protein
MCSEPELQPYLADVVADDALAAPLPEALAKPVVDCLKRLADQHWHVDARRSVVYARRIEQIGLARRDRWQQALGRMAYGDAIKFLGQLAEAWQALEEAGQMFLEVEDEVGWARTRIGRLHVSTALNRVPAALEDAERARVIFEQHGEREKLLRLRYQTGVVHNLISHTAQALEHFDAARALAAPMGDAGEPYLIQIENGAGAASLAQGDLRAALDHYDRVLALSEKWNEPVHIAAAKSHLAFVLQKQGHYRRALQLLYEALNVVRDLDPTEATRLKWHMPECYLNLSRYAEARELAEEVVGEFRKQSDAFWLAQALADLATAEAELGGFAEAEARLAEAEGIFETLGAEMWVAAISLRRGHLALRLGQPVAARRIAQQAALRFEAGGQPLNRMQAQLLESQAACAAHDYAVAEMLAHEPLHFAQRFNVAALRYSAYVLLGRCTESQGDARRAIRYYRAAAATTERVQRNLTITLRPGFLADKAEAPRRLVALHRQLGNVAQAFEALELSKAQVLLGYLANRDRLMWSQDDEQSRELLRQYEDVRAKHQWYQNLAEGAAKTETTGPVIDAQTALTALADLDQQLRRITEELYYRNGRRRIDPAPTVGVAEIQASLQPDTVLIAYHVDGEALSAFVVSDEAIAAVPLPASLAEVQCWTENVRQNLQAAARLGPESAAQPRLLNAVRRSLHLLQHHLLAPLLGPGHGWRRALIVPHGLLHYVPFHLLWDGERYLIEALEVVSLPAASLAVQPAPVRTRGALTLAHAWEGRLPFTHAEARMVQQTFGGEVFSEAAATRAALRAAPTQILHIAAHGQYRLDKPDLSYVYLAEGQVFADDLFQHDLSYELVTLSACETGQATVAGGDELIGLGRGFLYAGAGALVLSLWPVVDEIAYRLMTRFYDALRAGSSKAAALRGAQLAELAGAPQLHPAFWGAFQLIGNPGPLSSH